MTDNPTGDRYYSSASYILPSDEEERQRLLKQHQMCTRVFDNRVILAPVKWHDGDVVLEIGVAAGAWLTDAALEIAAQADVKYEAIDIEGRLFPKEPPKNTTYSVASVLELPDKWSDSFSFVHQRLLMGALTSTQWVTAVKELYRVTKPGGWVELSEGSEHLFCPEGRPRPHIQDLAIKVYLARGLKPNLGPELPNLLKDAGFVDITLVKREIPIGKWGGELGELGEFALGGFFRSIKKPVLDKGGLGVVENAQQFDALVESMVKEWNEVPGYNWYHYIAYARKPGGE